MSHHTLGGYVLKRVTDITTEYVYIDSTSGYPAITYDLTSASVFTTAEAADHFRSPGHTGDFEIHKITGLVTEQVREETTTVVKTRFVDPS